LLESPDLRESLGAAARKCAEQHYGWDAIGRDLLALYEPLLSERETSSAPTLVAEIAA
jgi:glycosyltransferase involved in cell wall biosynthesis